MSEQKKAFIHPQAIVEEGAMIGNNSRVWANAHILGKAVIGSDCNICDHTFIENDVVIGDNVTIKCGVYVWDGIQIEDDVFIGPNATFTNDKFPRSKQYPTKFETTLIQKGASIGANATILPVKIGKYAMIGAGSVVTKDVPPYAIVRGNPARIVGYVGAKETKATIKITEKIDKNNSLTGAKLYDISSFADIRGDLSVIECEKVLPFSVKRIFYTYNVSSSQVRGEHAHKICHQFLIAIAGSLSIIVDDGKNREEFVLNSPQNGLHLPAGCWGIQYKHSKDCVLLVLASHEYDSSDYIRDYDDFSEYTKSKK